ncbi:MAG: LapA family protein [Nitrospinota bacterium]|nr:LapA family protein [Nitrospinota bacterium]
MKTTSRGEKPGAALPGGPRFSMTAFNFILSIFLLIFIVSLAVENTTLVPVHYYDYQIQIQTAELPLMMVVFASLFLGFVVAWGAGTFKQVKLRLQLKKHKKTIRQMSEELEKLKSREF